MNSISESLSGLLRMAISLFCFTILVTSWDGPAIAQEAKPEKKESETSKPAETEKNAAQIELLETRYRFEENGDSRKEVHARVAINNELGVRQFARLNFDFNRSFQSVEIPLARITHPNGGIADILPSAITDNPNPAVVDAPAYHDIRVKSVRILGLRPGDLFEYRVITTTTHHPLAPDFWCDHSFDRAGVVSQEYFEVDLPASRSVEIRINPETPAISQERSGEGGSFRIVYRWKKNGHEHDRSRPSNDPDVILTTYRSWRALSNQISKPLEPSSATSKSMLAKAIEATKASGTSQGKLQALYELVAAKIRTVDLPIGATAFQTRAPNEILESGYATAEDKFALLGSLASSFDWETRLALLAAAGKLSDQLAVPSLFLSSAVVVHIPKPPEDLGHGVPTICDHCGENYWLAPAMEIAPFAAIPATLRGRQAFVVNYMLEAQPFATVPKELPFASRQAVKVDASISSDGTLNTKLKYLLRGDNELLLRVAFHQTPKEKWSEVAQLLAISDGFRGQITSVRASDPYATKEPFSVEYEISQPKFVDWSKKPVRIPALLPSPGLPDATPSSSGTTASGTAKKSIDLGTPLEVELDATVQLPEGATAEAPTGTSVERDYATFSSKYSAQGNLLHATRKLHFLLPEISATRTADFNAFLHAVQADQTQLFTLQNTRTATK